jgi:hypothetical protein
MLFPVRRIQVHVPSEDGQFDRSIVNTVTGFLNRDRAMLPIPTLEYTAGKCKRACYAHFKLEYGMIWHGSAYLGTYLLIWWYSQVLAGWRAGLRSIISIIVWNVAGGLCPPTWGLSCWPSERGQAGWRAAPAPRTVTGQLAGPAMPARTVRYRP